MSDQTRPSGAFGAVTKSDSTDIPKINGRYPRALYIGVGGDVVVLGVTGTPVTFKNATSGTVLPVQARRVGNSTTATDIIALY